MHRFDATFTSRILGETMNYSAVIASGLAKVFKDNFQLDKSNDELEKLVEVPKNLKMGDLAFPCFILAKALKKAPPMIASEIEELFLKTDEAKNFSSVKAMGPFLNFKIDRSQMANATIPAILSGDFLSTRPQKNHKVMVEYSQPNTHKAFHVGHTRNVSLGDALVRLYEWSGHEVVAVNYIGDVGAHIAKCLWFFTEHYLPNQSTLEFKNLQDCVKDLKTFKEKVFEYCDSKNMVVAEFLGQMYSDATELLDYTRLAKFPYPGILSAKVEEIKTHPENEAWKVVKVSTGENQFQVVCGGTEFSEGDIVAYASIGSRVAGRLVGESDKKGILSQGMILSEKELNLTDDKNKIFRFDQATSNAEIISSNSQIGQEISEITRKENKELEGKSVNELIASRNKAVSNALKQLESPGSEYYSLWQETKEWSMDEFKKIYHWLDARFDHFFFESDVGEPGKQVVKEFLEKGVFEKNEGAVGVRLEDKKLPFFLVLKSDGTGLYSTKDLALAKLKFEKYKIDKSIYVVDVAQSLHFQQVFATLEKMGFEQAKDSFHLAYGQVVLPSGKMSSRKGNVILFSQLQDSLEQNIQSEFLNKYRNDWTPEEIEEAKRKIAIATIKYGMLNQDNNKNIVFDLTEWTAKSGNTGPYMMYAYARTCSILRELEEKKPEMDLSKADFSLLEHETEQALVRKLSLFHEAVEKSVKSNEPQSLCIYLFELSKDFSRMYSNCSVLNADNEALTTARAALVKASGLVIQKGLALIGIDTLERM